MGNGVQQRRPGSGQPGFFSGKGRTDYADPLWRYCVEDFPVPTLLTLPLPPTCDTVNLSIPKKDWGKRLNAYGVGKLL